jgi:hypothetical protein
MSQDEVEMESDIRQYLLWKEVGMVRMDERWNQSWGSTV